MNSCIKNKLKNRCTKLSEDLKDFVFESYLNTNVLSIKNIDINKIYNDLGFISIDILEQDNYLKLLEYMNLIDKYTEQLRNKFDR